MTHHWIDHERALAGLPPRERHSPMTGEEFNLRARRIAATTSGHAAHRAMDMLTNELIRRLGPSYTEGLDLWLRVIEGDHAEGQPYPLGSESQPAGAVPASKE